ncbi:MAG: DoxX family protein [Clostridium sp.]|nr:DoxX family protein [Prevotella sp.]MCM1429253.1 DoxX family protein [Clostridium sp.]MCM1475714.1 DoxX family protein [Muribaculaceae bacterium]
MGRLFLRLFVGIMLIQFGVRQIIHFDLLRSVFPTVLGMSSETSLIVMIAIEIGASLFIMAGFMTRLMILLPFVAMVHAEYYVLTNPVEAPLFDWMTPGFLPMMFLGIYFFLWIVGPGKVSVDYFLSLHLLHSENRNEDELEEV